MNIVKWLSRAVMALAVYLAAAYGFLIHDLKQHFPGIHFSAAQFGVVSWYSVKDKYINPRTANNEKFDDTQLTCASWDYPFGTRLLVVNALNRKWVVCRVNDRGPNKRLKREADLTRAAFEKIANTRKGLIYSVLIPLPAQAVQSVNPAAGSGWMKQS